MDFGGDGGLSFSVVPTVYKREDYKRTKHDTVFSKWKVLIGSEDWEDFKKGKDGVGRYRVQNLPSRSCPGLYELGVVVVAVNGKLDSDDVLAAYLGQAESVRSRLQCYGRSGAHFRNLNNNLDGCCESPDKKAGLFEDIFMKHGSVVYRWAPMGSKREAEATEGMLLSTFDYAWNKGSNGERRHLDLLNKLGDLEFVRNRNSRVSRVLFPYVVEEERKLSCDVSTNFLTSVIKLSRSRPQLVSDKSDEIFSGGSSCSDSVCGVFLENGACCSKTPVKGRKRCIEHKGQRICRVSPVKPQQPETFITRRQDCNTDVVTTCCGVILPNIEPCSKRPVPGRKRCEDHKGMRINAFLFLLNRTDREKTVKDANKSEEEEEASKPSFCEATTRNGVPCTRSSPRGSKRCWQHKEKENIHPVVAGTQERCGVKVFDGLVCERSPVKGRKRCEEHKGMRVLIIPSS
ncbi:effector of transcription2 [Raphanus sativus]|uniref:Protein EFFECTOR OF TRANSCRIPTION 2-like n=1 Tax=Raphanus sativus TaxID=3726 RepID=A0A9W3BW29_RAPSA|nr:protein EFFECTOR OF TRANSCRIPTION 2-like [Raphanus sativus]KAJ4892420.1 effector of transcription2 [Raphanus sativus]